jgi:hypothetical protein
MCVIIVMVCTRSNAVIANDLKGSPEVRGLMIMNCNTVGAILLDVFINAQMSARGCEAEIICSI